MTLQQALDELAPLTPDQIRDKLRDAGIKSQHGFTGRWACDCPMALYLSKVTGQPITVILSASYPTNDYTPKCPQNPDSVIQFINNTDHGIYPELFANA